MIIRTASEGDAEQICRVHAAAIREICSSRYTASEIEAWASRVRPEGCREAMRTRALMVAELDGRVVGFGQLDPATGTVEALYIDPALVRQGIGSSLLRKLEGKARATGLRLLRLNASLNSVSFYQAAGFCPLHETQHFLTSGMGIACVAMEKKLVP